MSTESKATRKVKQGPFRSGFSDHPKVLEAQEPGASVVEIVNELCRQIMANSKDVCSVTWKTGPDMKTSDWVVAVTFDRKYQVTDNVWGQYQYDPGPYLPWHIQEWNLNKDMHEATGVIRELRREILLAYDGAEVITVRPDCFTKQGGWWEWYDGPASPSIVEKKPKKKKEEEHGKQGEDDPAEVQGAEGADREEREGGDPGDPGIVPR